MKKKVLFALALAATLAMTACGGAKKTETTVAATTEKASEKASESASENATEAAKEDGGIRVKYQLHLGMLLLVLLPQVFHHIL